MLAILEFVFFLLFLPYILFGMLLAHVADTIAQVFEPRLLLTGVWFGVLGGWLLTESTPDDTRPWQSLVEVVAQSHIGPVLTPVALLVVAGLLVATAAFVRLKRPR
jgi:hypothetical protein